MSQLFSTYLRKHTDVPKVPCDFLGLVVHGMKHLHIKGRSNVLYYLAKAIGTMRSDGSDSLLPATRMPMGLIEYSVKFYTASSIQQVNNTGFGYLLLPHDC